MRSRTKAAAVIGPLAVTLLLAGCGGSSTAAAPSATAASSLPSAAAAASTEPSAEASVEGDAAASDMASDPAANGAYAPVVDGDVSYQAWHTFAPGDGGTISLYVTNIGAEPVAMDRFDLTLTQGVIADGSTFEVTSSRGCGAFEEDIRRRRLLHLRSFS